MENGLQLALQHIVNKGESQTSVARRLHVSQAAISRILSGSRRGSLDMMSRVVREYPEVQRFFVSPNIPNG